MERPDQARFGLSHLRMCDGTGLSIYILCRCDFKAAAFSVPVALNIRLEDVGHCSAKSRRRPRGVGVRGQGVQASDCVISQLKSKTKTKCWGVP